MGRIIMKVLISRGKLFQAYNDSYYTDATWCAAMLSVPLQLKEDPSCLIKKASSVGDSRSPIIAYSGAFMEIENEFSIFAENVQVANTTSFVDAVGLLLASYFSFNLAYPSQVNNTLTFIQKILIGHCDYSKLNLS